METKNILITDKEAVTEYLASVTGKITRTVDYDDIIEAAKNAEATLKNVRVKKMDWGQVTVTVNPTRNRQPKVKSFRYSVNTVTVTIAYGKKGWFIIEATRSGGLFDTKANDHNQFVNIPEELLNVQAMKDYFGIVTPSN